MLTDIPVGCWSLAAVLDAVELITGNEEIGSASDIAIGFGLLGAVGAAVTGAADWSETDGRGKRLGVVHAGLNIVATVLYTASLVSRRRGSRRTGIALSLTGYALSSFSAYLGGHLVFGEQVGVDHTATADAGKPTEWTRVATYASLPENTPTRVEVDGIALVLVRRGGIVCALTNTCSHLGGPLHEGTLDGDGIRCPWHGSRFCLADGQVLDGPAQAPARAYDVRVTDGELEVRARR